MAMLYRDLAALSDRELAACGLARQDIPRAVLSAIHGGRTAASMVDGEMPTAGASAERQLFHAMQAPMPLL